MIDYFERLVFRALPNRHPSMNINTLPPIFFCLIKKSNQKKSRLHFSFLSAKAMQAHATMGATSYIYWSYLCSIAGRYLEKEK
jgi:hypothetical protein